MQTQVVLDRSALLELAPEAAAAGLWPSQLEHTPAWLVDSDHGPGAVAGAVRVDEGGRLAAYLPMRLRPTGLAMKVGEFRVARLPYTTVQLFGQGLIGGSEPAACAALAALQQLPRWFDAATLEETPTDCPLWRAATGGMLEGYAAIERGRATHRLVELPESFDDYFAALAKKTRTNLRRGTRFLDELFGGHELRTYTSPDQVEDLARAVEVVVKKTFHYHLLGQDLTRANDAFVRNLASWARHGLLRSYVLWGGETAVAYVIGYVVGRRYQYEQIAYDPDPAVARASPGNYLLSRIVCDLISSRAASVLDFGSGDAEYKRVFGNSSFEEGRMLLVRRRPYSLAVAHSERLFARTSRGAARLLDRLGLRSPLKSLVRRHARGV